MAMSCSSSSSSVRLRLNLAPSRRRIAAPANLQVLRRVGVAAASIRLRAARATGGDARQPFDHVPRGVEEVGEMEEDEERRRRRGLKIAVVGFGNYGQFLTRTLVRQGHTVLAHSRSDYSAVAAELGATYFTDAHDLVECHPDVVLLVTSILSAEAVLRSLPVHRLRRDTLFADVLSVKEFPRNLLLGTLPEEFDIICTHPMFGSTSSRARAAACCAEHDAHAAETQFLTHTVGRTLAMLELQTTPINTKGYETLLRLVDNTCSDSFDLYNGLFMYNNNSTELLNRLEWAMDSVKKRLFDGLHDVLRRQLFEGSPPLDSVSAAAAGSPPDDAPIDGDLDSDNEEEQSE
uniref:Prephenate/arogenate dehydrogenase domain-containing protein n=1 Tax=Oryza barthii TaxID=65489 RepID=A0A0D3GKP9_9ORYZ